MITVLDTNSLVAGVISSNGPCAEILDRWRDGEFEVAVSPDLIDEIRRVLAYPRIARKYSVPPSLLVEAVEELRTAGLMFDDHADPERFVPADAGDDYVVALAQAAAAEFLVTRDKHFHDVELAGLSFRIVTPEEFLAHLRGEVQ